MAPLFIGYARVSTDEQDLTAQRDGLTALGVSAERIYVDHGLTGTHRDRPGLREAFDTLESAPAGPRPIGTAPLALAIEGDAPTARSGANRATVPRAVPRRRGHVVTVRSSVIGGGRVPGG